MINKLMMNSRTFVMFTMLALVATFAAAGSALGQAPDDVDDSDIKIGRNTDLTGTWAMTITPDDGSPSFTGFYSFGADGNASFSSAGPPIPGLGNPGYGVWKKLHNNRYQSVIKMVSYTSTFQFDGTLRIRAQIQMTGPNSFVTTDAVTIYDVNGKEIVTFGGNAAGRRITAND